MGHRQAATHIASGRSGPSGLSGIAGSAGISLVDLMVGLTIGMVATVVILQVALLFDAQRRMTSGSLDANLSAVHALASLVRDIRMAGNGLGPIDAIGCNVHRAATGQPEAVIAWRPITIINGQSGSPDTFTTLAADTTLTAPARLIAPYTPNEGAMMLDTTLGLEAGDRLVVQSAGHPDCALLTAGSVSVGGYAVSPADAAGLLPGTVFATGSAVIKVGPLRYRRYAIDSDQRLQASALNLASGNWSRSELADGVVNLQLQYGFDARPGMQATPQVSLWSDEAFDADGNGVAGDAADWRRLLAVRIAVVTRSAQRRDGACDALQPQWLAGTPPGGALQATPIRVDHLSDWKCWRYRVLQTEVPLRNQLWRDG